MSQSDELKSLRRRRGSCKAKLTYFSNYLDTLQGEAYEITEIEQISLKQRLNKFENLLNEFEQHQDEIEFLCVEPEKEYEEREAFQNQYFHLISTAMSLIQCEEQPDDSSSVKSFSSNQNRQNVANTNNANAGTSRPSTNATNIPSQPQSSPHGHLQNNATNAKSIKLPTIALPDFEGGFETWLEYRDLYESLIHTNSTISDIQRFHYLRASLKGEAAEVIKAFTFCEANYSSAWDLICCRYNNPALLIHNHVKALFELAEIKEESAINIRTLVDGVNKHISALSALGQTTSGWDVIIIHLLTEKLDPATRREWEESKDPHQLGTFKELIEFLKKKADTLSLLAAKESQKSFDPNYTKYRNKPFVRRSLSAAILKCNFCQGDHYVTNCDSLIRMPISTRMTTITNLKLCINCLRSGHMANTCKSTYSCKTCGARHHSLLHVENYAKPNHSAANQPNNENTQTVSSNCNASQIITILPTALVFVNDNSGHKHVARALLDTGSQANFVSSALARKLNLDLNPVSISVMGIGGTRSRANNECTVKIQSRVNAYTLNVQCLTTNKIVGSASSGILKPQSLAIPQNLKLADPSFDNASEIDILLGSNCFWQLLSVGQHELQYGLVMQKTRFGWVVSGGIQLPIQAMPLTCNSASVNEINNTLMKFWKLEDFPEQVDKDTYCEEHFQKTYSRNAHGRFVVNIPFKDSIQCLGNSYENAIRRFYALEKRLEHYPDLKQRYIEFIREYIALGHMSPSKDNASIAYYLPHHCVINEASVTTKLRVVFDGSAPATCGKSINDLQYVGPTIQDELLNILLRFRVRKYIVLADISKMYRQVLVSESQRQYQRILWRENKEDVLQSYDLNTVTYGTASASYLAIRCLEQLGRDIQNSNANVAYHIRKSFYVDNLIAGFDNQEEAVEICVSIYKTLMDGGFELRMWASNSETIISSLTKLFSESETQSIHTFDSSGENKMLGLQWCRKNDLLFYHISNPDSKRVTKRTILSHLASIFDPLGLVAPCTIVPKKLIQTLWLEKLHWDESIPSSLATQWLHFRQSLNELGKIRIPRLVVNATKPVHMHGFCDASQMAYGACIYLVSEGEIKPSSFLLCAKSKVSPLKVETIPRLELCAAALLVRLLDVVHTSIDIPIKSVTLWSDSVVALCWLRGNPASQKPFIGNRVKLIQTLSKNASWRYIPTTANPADILSRGTTPAKLQNFALWWQGPEWLNKPSEWPTDISLNDAVLSLNAEIDAGIQEAPEPVIKFNIFQIDNHSALRPLIHKAAFVLRFIHNIRIANKVAKIRGPLSLDELQVALTTLIKLEQQNIFRLEITQIQAGKSLKPCRIFSLNPFIDDNGLLRVGGRLGNSSFSYSKKHPIILPSHNHLTKLIFENEHRKLLHAGPQLLLNSLRERYWPLLGRNTAKNVSRTCMRCRRVNPPKMLPPLMGDLPKHRVEFTFPFINCGVDFAGPFLLKTFNGRGTKTYKSYIALFACLSTKALHLELVTGLDTPCFLSCLRRFVARRGKPANIFSDNGTNFRGANNELQELYSFINQNRDDLIAATASEGLRWHFIPAYSPNFGGLWEAGVKSTKFHLLRVIGDRLLTYEDFMTLLCQIEAILNSRPISPLSSNPEDLFPLTPAHLIIGRTFQNLPDDVSQIPESTNENRLDRFQKIQALVRGFWKRWSTDYINTLQQRSKWRSTQHHSLSIDDLVVLQDSNQPPLQWKLGRIIKLHPGHDGITRVVSIKTTHGVTSRAITKICPLLQQDDNS